MSEIVIRKASENDFPDIWEIFRKVIEKEDSFAWTAATTRQEAHEVWFSPKVYTYVAREDNKILGAYFIKANQPGLGSHIANAAYMVDPEQQGRGIATKLCLHSLEEAKQKGFRAMQFNIVVSTNLPAVHLWQKLGFKIIGTTPEAFKHREKGFVDAHIMYRSLV